MNTSLLDILVCPVCRSTLAVDEEASTLVCAACPRAYEVRDGIPVMTVPDDSGGG